jgi:hypothetical protein
MRGDPAVDYLGGLPADQRAMLAGVNGPGLAAVREYLVSGQAVAFLGAGVSAPLYQQRDLVFSPEADHTACLSGGLQPRV